MPLPRASPSPGRPSRSRRARSEDEQDEEPGRGADQRLHDDRRRESRKAAIVRTWSRSFSVPLSVAPTAPATETSTIELHSAPATQRYREPRDQKDQHRREGDEVVALQREPRAAQLVERRARPVQAGELVPGGEERRVVERASSWARATVVFAGLPPKTSLHVVAEVSIRSRANSTTSRSRT